MRYLKQESFLVVLLSVVLLPGCASEGVNTGDLNIIGLDEEWQLGEELATRILSQAPRVEDPLVQSYIDEMGARIVAVTERNDRPWRFHVLQDTSVNAFNIPGGHVFLNSGLIQAANRSDEVAGVLAHEIGHGVARHATERMTATYGLNLLLRLVVGGETNLLEQIAAQILGSGALAKFSRDDEREADRLGLAFMAEAGYRPRGMISMFEVLMDLEDRSPSAVEQFFSTHPLTESRIAELKKLEAEMSVTVDSGDEALFPVVQDRIRRNRSRHWESTARPAP